MQKDTENYTKIPSRISVSFDTKTDKYTIKQDTNGSIKVYKNRLVVKDCTTEQDIINLITASFGFTAPPKPDLQEKDEVRVPFGEDEEHDLYRTWITAKPILDFQGIWQVPVFIPNIGHRFVKCENVKLIRRIKK